MKKIILLFLSLNLVFAQLDNPTRSLTIYKDNFALVNEPIVWNLKLGRNISSFTNISSFLFRAFLTNIKNKTPKKVTDKIIIVIVLII